jgi:hypothetical protein
MLVMTRQEALNAGAARYFTGKPCPQGHVAMRRVSGACVEYARLGKIEWRKANPERVRALKSAEQKRNRSSANARNRRWYAAHTAQANAANAAWAKANRDKATAKSARYRADRMQRSPLWADQGAINLIYRTAHVLRGIGVSGLHVHGNLQLIASKANKAKGNTFAAKGN